MCVHLCASVSPNVETVFLTGQLNKGLDGDVQEDVEKKILKASEIFHWSFELTAAGRSLVRVQLRSVLHLLCIKAATG